ncbi:HGF [Branchiostoma lanceolatum]|uniref:HGF protein n=1 Tax=Branchiostoma lanceolatum TaxID=7740 RepID=A0A8K0A0V2_BRALA|nr:HGF [Branchiostoma lanceolatum]
MHCDEVFACDAVPTRCFYALDKGRSYAGHMNRAGDGVCQRWDSQSPNSHPHTPEAHPDAGLEENFCRNPDNKERPWCYTTDPVVRWSFCDIMECADPTSLDFMGQECKGSYTCEKQIVDELKLPDCFCDDDCSFFGDCCEDVEVDSSAQPPPDYYQQQWRCLPGYTVLQSQARTLLTSSWVVAGCPDEWKDGFTRDQCLKQVGTFNPRDTVYRIPVRGNDTYKIPYRNMFCALCNNVTISEASTWMPEPVCSGQLSPSAQTSVGTQENINILRTLGLKDVEGCLGANKLEFQIPNARLCLAPKAYSTNGHCDMTACMSYTYPVFSRYKNYRNIHCALCEGLSLTATTYLRCGTAFGRGGPLNVDIGLIRPELMSLTRLFNFDVNENSPNKCPSDTVYDPFVDTCRHFSSASSSHGSSNTTSPLQNCSEPALTFTADEFSVLPNGSVLLLSSNVSCPAEQVALLNTTASICGECILEYFSKDAQTTISPDPAQGWLTLGLVIVSAVAVAGFVVYTVWSGQWEKVPEKLKVQMIVCMALAEVMFVVRLFVPPGQVCAAYAIGLHYLFLTAFTSMNALAVDLFLTFRDGLERVALYKYLLYTWLMPVPVVVMAVIVEFCSSVRVGYGEHCWIGNPTASLVAFGAPVFCILLVNAALVTFVLLTIRKSFKIADVAKSRSGISKAWVYLRISFLAGFTWILGFIYPYVNSRVLDYIFIVLNASQGLLLAVALTMTSKVVQKWKSAIRARFGLGEPHHNNGATATSSNRRAAAGGTEATAGGTATDIPMATLADVEENRARLPLAEVIQHNGENSTASNGLNTADGAEALAGGIGSAAEIPMSTSAHLEENRARLRLVEAHQDDEKAAPASNQQDTVDGVEATPGGTGSAADMPTTTLADMEELDTDVEENGAQLHLAEVHQHNDENATAYSQQATAGGTEATAGGAATDIPMATLTDVEENRTRLRPAEVHQHNEENAPAAGIPMSTLADVEENRARPRPAEENTTAADIPMATLTDVEENRTRLRPAEVNQHNEENAPAAEIPMSTLADVEENTGGDEKETRL